MHPQKQIVLNTFLVQLRNLERLRVEKKSKDAFASSLPRAGVAWPALVT